MGGLNPFENQPLIESSSVTLASMDDTTSSNVASRTCGSMFCAVIGITLFIAALQFSFVIPPGSIGLVVTLGHVEAFDSGLHYRFPFISSVEMLSSKTQKLEQNNMIPTKEGLAVKLDTAVLYRLDQAHAAELYREVGTDYVHTLLEPEAASAVRGLTSESEAKALYSSGRSTIQESLKEELTAKLGPRGIIVEDVLLKDIELPEQLSKSIELKVQAEQEAARMEFVLKKEKQEAERKAIEAQGIADFQRIVSEGISPELLQWKGVEATEKFAGAPNTKIVIMGNSGGDLPVILSAANDSPSEQHS
jgi:prohibitin 1